MPTEKAKPENAKANKKAEEKRLDDELDDTFPASDPPSTTEPGHGETGPEVKRFERK
jgi:hypothetical protein